MLTKDHKRQRVEVASEFLGAYGTDGENFWNPLSLGTSLGSLYDTGTKELSRQ